MPMPPRMRVMGCCLLLMLAVGAKRGPKEPAAEAAQPPLPDAVKKTVEEHFPGKAIVSYEHQVDDSRHLFFVDIQSDKGQVTLLSSGRGQYLGMVSEMPDDDDADVYIDYDTAPPAVKDGIGKHLIQGLEGKQTVTVDALFMEVEAERFMFVAEVGGAGTAGGTATQPKSPKGVPSGGAVWWTFSIGGNLVSVEKEIPITDLPRPVAAAIKGKILSVSVVDDKEKKTTSYVLDVGGAGGAADQELTLSPDGKLLSTQPVEPTTTKP